MREVGGFAVTSKCADYKIYICPRRERKGQEIGQGLGKRSADVERRGLELWRLKMDKGSALRLEGAISG